MTSLLIKLPKTASKNSDPPRRKPTKRATSPLSDDATTPSASPLKRPRAESSDLSEEEDGGVDSSETFHQSARMTPGSSSSRAKPKPPAKKKSKIVLSDSESEDFEPPEDESEHELPVDDDDYMSEPKNSAKRAGGGKGRVATAAGGKGKKKAETKEIMAKDERKRPISTSEPAAVLPASKRPRTNLKPPHKSGDVIVDVVGDGPATAPNPAPPKEDSAPVPPKKSKLPPIKKNKAPTTASGGSVPASGSAGTSNLSIPPKPAPLAREEDSKLPPPIVGARKATIPLSVDLDLSNPMMYAQLFKSGGGSTPSGFTRREKDEERRKELNRMRDEAKSKRVSDAATAFDLQGQMDKITRFEERLRSSRSPAVYPNFLAGALKALQGKKCFAGADLEAREEGEM